MIGKIIYLVEKTTGYYEDRFTEIVKAKTTREAAENFIKEQEKKYECIPDISCSWDRWANYIWDLVDNCGDDSIPKDEKYNKLYDKYFEKEDDFIEYIKTYFPEDFEMFGEDKLRFAFDLDERGQLFDHSYYSIKDIIVED